jgi:hypothetical protein
MSIPTQNEGAAPTAKNRSLSYIDFINGESATPVVRQVEEQLGMSIRILPAQHDCSGPKEDQAIEIFNAKWADCGRL